MFGFLKDSGWNGLRGTVEGCDDCETSTLHLTAPGGVSVCGMCGYSSAFEEIEQSDDSAESYGDDDWGW